MASNAATSCFDAALAVLPLPAFGATTKVPCLVARARGEEIVAGATPNVDFDCVAAGDAVASGVTEV
jgi:hypothetical protein